MQRIKKFLFSNIHLKQVIFKNTFWLTYAEVVTQITKLFSMIFVVRILGAASYGGFSFALSLIVLFWSSFRKV